MNSTVFWFTACNQLFYLSKRSKKKRDLFAFICPNSRNFKCHYMVLLSYAYGDPDWNDSSAYKIQNWTVVDNPDVQLHNRMPEDGARLAETYGRKEIGFR